MNDSNSRGIAYSKGFFILIAFCVAGLLLSPFIIQPIWNGMTGLSLSALKDGMIDPKHSSAYKIIQSVAAVFSYFLPAVLAALYLNKKPFRLLGFSSQVKINQAGLTVGIILLALFVSVGLSYINNIIPIPANWKIRFDKMEADYNAQVTAIIGLKSYSDYLFSLVVMAFVPAVCEETLFRGGFQNFLVRGRMHPWAAILLMSLLFSIVHFSYYGLLSRFFLGVVLGLIYHYSGKLWLSILAHFINNALAVTVLYISVQQGKSIEQAMKQTNDSYWQGILFVPILILLFVFFKRVSEGKPWAKSSSNF